MHASVPNETKTKKEIRASNTLMQRQRRSKQPQPNADVRQRKHLAANAATSMAEVLQQRGKRQPRSLTWWSEKKKAVVERYPDGRQEIIVPQILTPEQEHYQFPPRSKFLRQLQAAEATGKQRRSSSLSQSAPAPSSEHLKILSYNKIAQPLHSPTVSNGHSSRKMHPAVSVLDESALKDWFSKNSKKTLSRTSKDRAVDDWITEVERSKQLPPATVSKKRPDSFKASPVTTTSFGGCGHRDSSSKMQFKSAAGRRWADILNVSETLAPPDETCRIHYIPRRLLMMSKKIELKKKKAAKNDNNQYDPSTTVSRIQHIWKEYKSSTASSTNNSDTTFESKVASIAMNATRETTPMAAMVLLLLQTHNAPLLKSEQKQYFEKTVDLEARLAVERNKRHEAITGMKSMEAAYQQMQQTFTMDCKSGNEVNSNTLTEKLLSRIAELEAALEQEKMARQKSESRFLQKSANAEKKLTTARPSQPTPAKRSIVSNSKSRTTSLDRSQTATKQIKTASRSRTSNMPILEKSDSRGQPKALKKRERISTLASIGLIPDKIHLKASKAADKRTTSIVNRRFDTETMSRNTVK